MTRTLCLAALLAGVSLASASAQPPAAAPPPGGNARIMGVVTAATEDSVTIKGADGKITVVPLSRTWTAIGARPVDIDAIKPGSFVATANTDIDANSGKSIELRIFEPGNKGGEGSRPMGQPHTTMTNATVQTVTKGPGGRELDLTYPGGTRHIIVPPDVQVIGQFPLTHDKVAPGAMVTVNTVKDADGVAHGTRITVAEK